MDVEEAAVAVVDHLWQLEGFHRDLIEAILVKLVQDEKIQDVLGDCQKDFEGGVSAEKLGAKFGGYGSFLATHQRSHVSSYPKTPPISISLNNAHIKGVFGAGDSRDL